MSLSWIRPIQSIPHHPISPRAILMLSTTHVLAFLVVTFLPAFPQITYMHSSSPLSCYVPFPSHSPRFDHSNYAWRWVQVMKLLVLKYSPLSCDIFPVRSEYSPQHLVLKRPQSITAQHYW
jgi:hypothetical protein